MKKIIILIVVSLGLFLSNCVAVGPQQGAIVTATTFPGEINKSNNVASVKKAEGCTNTILHLVSWGSAAAGQVALDNKITRIASIDHSAFSVLGIYKSYCTIVSGE
ncbi:TRL-like family protein [Leptospira ellisii]|uniref:TRL-like family protein n=1 Tax=Leptospira ellisii TaxID=2023197 RepID=A0A2N0BP90_9LEPT|nr:TRL-like family protein [Leptospira ellisii]MDV6236505.1 TRL-like family protein [Leptospira ellisii]PJZ94544.1 TRL-like family protein [Leptospira ellisii]PKA05810.1 TRL-like family protein [Leptospira ellisii]